MRKDEIGRRAEVGKAEWELMLSKLFYSSQGPSEAEEFQLEVSGLLGEMNCPYPSLTSGDVTKRLLVQKNCLLLLSKFMATRM